MNIDEIIYSISLWLMCIILYYNNLVIYIMHVNLTVTYVLMLI